MGAAFEQCEAGMFFVEMIKRIKTTKIRWEQDTGILRQATDRRGGDQKSSGRQDATETGAGNRKVVGIPEQETGKWWRYQRI